MEDVVNVVSEEFTEIYGNEFEDYIVSYPFPISE